MVTTVIPREPLLAPATTPGSVLEERFAARLLDVLIRAGLVLAMAVLVYRVFSPFLTLTVWAVILAVTLYPLNRLIARRVNGRQGIAATLLVLLCIGLLVVPTAVLMNSLGDTIQDFITRVQTNALEIPPPPDRVAAWPFVGAKLHATWSRAHDDLPGLVQSLQPKIGELARGGARFRRQHRGRTIIVPVLLHPGRYLHGVRRASGTGLPIHIPASRRQGARGRVHQPFRRDHSGGRAGRGGRGFDPGHLVGLCLLIAGVPWAGALAAIVLVLGIAQVPAVIVTLPAIAYIWTSGIMTASRQSSIRYCCWSPDGGQRAQATDARPRRGRADAGDPGGSSGRHGSRRHCWHVCWGHIAGVGLSTIQGVGCRQAGTT